jgi:DNA polymerase-3 subunit alpha
LYRPALMNGGQKDLYLANRKAAKGKQTRLHKTFDDILDVTAGVPIFQEQVMQMCKHIGMAYEDWNDLMKAVKASNDKIEAYAEGIFQRIEPLFIALCIKKGTTRKEAEAVWDSVVGFTDYGFNRAHATGYGITAYRSAYLKAHYPLEFMQSLLTVWAGTTQEKRYIAEARRMGIAIGRADVNLSAVGWAVDPTKKAPTLRKGFRTLKGIGENVAEAIIAARPDGGWQTMEDFIDAVPARPVSGGKDWKKNQTLCGVMQKLRENGALSSLGVE